MNSVLGWLRTVVGSLHSASLLSLVAHFKGMLMLRAEQGVCVCVFYCGLSDAFIYPDYCDQPR